jgi:hypothetical protein
MISRSYRVVVAVTLLCWIVACSGGTPSQLAPALLASDTSLYRAPSESAQFVAHAGACGFCHASPSTTVAPLVGGELLSVDGQVFRGGSLLGVTTERSVRDLRALIRLGRYLDSEEQGQPFGHQGFEWVTESDLAQIVAFVQALRSEDESYAPERTADSVKRQRQGWLSFLQGDENNGTNDRAAHREVPGIVPELSKTEPYSYGQYLLGSIARCQVCHQGVGGFFSAGEPFEGGRTISRGSAEAVAPSLVEFVRDLSVQDISMHLRRGTGADGRKLNSELCPTEFTKAIPAQELDALAHGLKSLTPGA